MIMFMIMIMIMIRIIFHIYMIIIDYGYDIFKIFYILDSTKCVFVGGRNKNSS